MAVVAAGKFVGGVVFERIEPFFGAEAVVRFAFAHQLLGVRAVHPEPFALDVGAVGAADVGAFVVAQADGAQRIVYHLFRAVHIALAVGVFDPQDKLAALRPGNQIFIQRRTQVAHVHKSGGAGRKPGTNFFHLIQHPLRIGVGSGCVPETIRDSLL